MALVKRTNAATECHSILKKYFKFHSFRNNQLEVILNTINGNDSLVIMATGSGKSLCYQIPPLFLNKPAIIISPLVSLIQNQVTALKDKGIPAIAITQNTSYNDISVAFNDNKYKLIYITPEGVESKLNLIKSLNDKHGISVIGIDESHCVVEWGFDFRPSYQKLYKIRDTLADNTPIIALTATATPKMQKDIVQNLKLRNLLQIRSTFNRINLKYYFIKKQSTKIDLITNKQNYYKSGSTIIYCNSRRDCSEIANLLQLNGINAVCYHAGLNYNTRINIQNKWEKNQYQCIVATVAFGMGIDKPDIRYVIHYGIPKSIESYYQQTGRAGRDGKVSQCIMYWNDSDFSFCEWCINESQTDTGKELALKGVQSMKHLVYSTECRIKVILHHFGESEFKKCVNRCDNCDNQQNKALKEEDFNKQTKLMIHCITEIGQNYTMNKIVSVCNGSNNKDTRKIFNVQKKKSFGCLSEYGIKWIKSLGRNLVQRDILSENIESFTNSSNYNTYYKKIKITQKGYDLLNNKYILDPWVPDSDMIRIQCNNNNNNNNSNKNNGRPKPWLFENDLYLWKHKNDKIEELKTYFCRDNQAILLRLKHLNNPNHRAYIRINNNKNIIQNNTKNTANTPVKKTRNAGKKWTVNDDADLWKNQNNKTDEELAESFGRSVISVAFRLENLEDKNHKTHKRLFGENKQNNKQFFTPINNRNRMQNNNKNISQSTSNINRNYSNKNNINNRNKQSMNNNISRSAYSNNRNNRNNQYMNNNNSPFNTNNNINNFGGCNNVNNRNNKRNFSEMNADTNTNTNNNQIPFKKRKVVDTVTDNRNINNLIIEMINNNSGQLTKKQIASKLNITLPSKQIDEILNKLIENYVVYQKEMKYFQF